jgi:hypothetical protein
LPACRIAAVATIRIVCTPHSCAIRTCEATSSATASTFSTGIASPLRDPSLVNARVARTSCSRPSCDSATRSRVVFEPMSMQAQRIGSASSLA